MVPAYVGYLSLGNVNPDDDYNGAGSRYVDLLRCSPGFSESQDHLDLGDWLRIGFFRISYSKEFTS